MFFVNLKLTKKRTFLFAVFSIFILICALCVGYKSEYNTSNSVAVGNDVEDIRNYLSSFELELGEITVDKISVPYEFNDVYTNYNLIQQSQGFDLSEFKGKDLTRYTAQITNYTDFNGDVFAEVLVFDKIIVGADIYSTAADGFIVALK